MIKEIAYKNHDEWLKYRMNGIGGSDAGAVIGLNPYKSAYELWAEKTGKLPGFDGNLTTEVGTYLEDFVAKLFEKETGKTVRRKNRIITNTDYPFAFGNVDRVITRENSFLECKTTNSFPAIKKMRSGDFPEQWYAQVVHYMAVGNFDKAYLAVLINCREFKVFELERDEDEIRALMCAEQEFWDKVQKNEPPAADGTESTSETLTALYPEANGETVSLFAYDTALAQYMALTSQRKELGTLIDEQANIVKSFMRNSERGESDRYRVSWINESRNTFDIKRFTEEHPETDLSRYYKKSSYRAFRVTAKAE